VLQGIPVFVQGMLKLLKFFPGGFQFCAQLVQGLVVAAVGVGEFLGCPGCFSQGLYVAGNVGDKKDCVTSSSAGTVRSPPSGK
jgi:hypothetical protein